MSGALIVVEVQGLGYALARLSALASPSLRKEGLTLVGGLVESQTKLRIQSGGPGPEGEPWAAWSESYAASRHHGHALLQDEGYLLGSIAAYEPEGDSVTIGSNLVYAAIQQFGGADGMRPGPAAIPARPYLGVSASDARQIDDEIRDWIAGVLQ